VTGKHFHHHTYGGFLELGVSETRKAPLNQGAFSIIVVGQKSAFD
jgi:hypothetical protein|tara:strand:- start:526 stop:660 length:135 start_codon:yes stop_codon:yes gene_type:complete